MLYKLHSFFFLLATLLLFCNTNFGQTSFVDRNSDYITTKRILTVENGLPANSVLCAIQDKDGFMWFGTEKGLSRYDGKSFTNYSKEKNGLSGDKIIQLLLDDSNRLVIISANNMTTFSPQADLMDLRTFTISAAKSISNYANLKPPLNWKTNENSNLKYLENSIALYLENKRIEIYSKEELSNLPAPIFSGNYLDQYGNNWLCSNSGVFEIRCRKKLFDNYFNSNQPTKPFNKQVRNIYTEADFKNDKSDKRIYACMGNKFLIQKNNKVETVTSKDFFIYSMLKTSEKFYVGGSAILVLDLKKLAFQGESNKFSGEIWSMYPASRHTIYVATNVGIFLYNDSTHKAEQLKASNNSFPLTTVVYRFVQTLKHGLFVVAQNGLFQIKKNTIVDYYGPGALGTHKLPIDDIYDMYEDKEGICWIASNGNGLYRWNWAATDKKGALENYSLQAGLPSDILCRIEEDDNNNLWVSTYNGLFSFNKENRSVYSFNTSDGIINNEFDRASSFKGPDGRMYFGTINGLTAFYPAEVLKNAVINSVPFQVTMINKYSVAKNDFEPCMNEYRSNNKIVIHPGEGLLTVEFSLLDFQERPYVYRYNIEGLPGKWKLGEGNTLNINSLSYGEYNLKIQAQLANGQWNPIGIEIAIVVLKPFYFKPWFIILCVIALAALTRWYITSKTDKLLQSKIRLETLVQSRTTSLSNALHDKDLLIKEVHHRVKNNLQVIISLLHLQNDKITDENMKLSILESQSRIGSIALIHQNLYQNGQLDGIRFDEFVINLGKQLDDFYKELHRKISLETNIVKTYIDIDTAVPLGLILNELFSNTYKHAFKNTSNIKVTVSMQEISKGEYTLVFHDSGTGLSDELLFNNVQTLGMELIRGLAKQLHGKASYQYKEGAGFTIFFKDSITRKNA